MNKAHELIVNGPSVDLAANGIAPATGEQIAEKWLPIAVVGKWPGHPSRPYEISESDIGDSLIAFWRRRYAANGVDLVVDYEHQSVTAATSGIKAPAAGWVKDFAKRDGKGAVLIAWNSAAADLIARKEYRYLSPVFGFNRKDPTTGKVWPVVLDSIALTNKPFLTELPAIANSSDGVAGQGSTVALKEGESMNLLQLLATALELELQAVADMLGCAVDAADEAVVTAVASKLSPSAPNSVKARLADVALNVLGLEATADETAIRARGIALKAPAAGLSVVANSLGLAADTAPEKIAETITALRAQSADRKAEELVANAVAGGKIVPAQREFFLANARANFTATEMAINSMSKVISDPTKGGAPPAGAKPALTADQSLICRQLGIAEDKLAPAQ